jgi:hypothetical protein
MSWLKLLLEMKLGHELPVNLSVASKQMKKEKSMYSKVYSHYMKFNRIRKA